MPMTSGPAPAALPMTPSMVIVLPAVAAKPPPLPSSVNGRRLAPALSIVKVALPTTVPPFSVTVEALAASPKSLSAVTTEQPPFSHVPSS